MSATYADGYRATAVCFVVGPDAVGKARKTAESIIERTRAMFQVMGMKDFTDVNIQVCLSVYLSVCLPVCLCMQGLSEYVCWTVYCV